MPAEPKAPVVPTTAPPVVVPAPAAPVAPAASPKPAAEPRSARPATPAAPSIRPPDSSVRRRPTISAKKALGLEETPRKAMEGVTKAARDRINLSTPTTGELKTEVPIVVAPVVPAAPAAAAEPVVPVEVPPVAAAPAAPVPAKIKVGDKEYTPEELEAALKKESPAPASASPRQDAAPSAPALTKEQIAASEKKFVEDTIKVMDAPLTEAEMDTILAGGKDAVETFQAIRKRDMATTLLETRKSVADSLNPLFDEIIVALRPLVQNFQQVQRYTVEQQFVSKHADFAPHVETARSIAEELMRLYPQQVAKMSQEQFIDEVARQTDLILTDQHRRWFPQGNGNWRASAAPAPAAPVAPAPAAAPAVAASAATVPAPVPAAPQPTRVVRAPAANAPVGAGGSPPPGWGKSVASSMRG